MDKKDQIETNSLPYRQRQAILRLLLWGSIGLSLIAVTVISLTPLLFHRSAAGIGSHVTFIVFLFFLLLAQLNKKGYTTLAAFLFCLVYFAVGVFMITTWGILVAQGLLLFVLAIVTSSILIKSSAGIFFTILSCVVIAIVQSMHAMGLVPVDLTWGQRVGAGSDVFIFSGCLIILMITSWLSNREIERAFTRTQLAEQSLKRERDQLEDTVASRTKELQQKQQAEVQQLYEMAYFGKVTSSLLHDLANPLSSVSLSLKRIEPGESSRFLKRAIDNTKRIERYLEHTRLQLRHNQIVAPFSLQEVAERVLAGFADICVKQSIVLKSDMVTTSDVSGDQIKFERLLTNLLSNAVDSFGEHPVKARISVTIRAYAGGYLLTVQDNGSGIPKDAIGKVFDPFFTTKSVGKGMGIGLSICKEIVENDFNGEIVISSQPKNGTTIECYLLTKRTNK